jgi:hypothetical protein
VRRPNELLKVLSGCSKGMQCPDDCAVEHDALDAAALTLTEGTLRRNANLLDPWLPWGSFEAAD